MTPNDEYNQKLVENVRPSGWAKEPDPDGYDFIAIGGGTAGLVATGGAAMLGAKTALIEREYLGGDCLVSGCVPSKALLMAAKVAHSARNAEDFGIDVGGVSVDFAKVMEKLRQTRSIISSDDSAKTVTERGVDVLYGQAKFTSRNTLDLNGKAIKFKRAIICTGGRAVLPPVPGLKEANPLTNETLFNLTKLPKHLAIIGGGAIGCEMSQALSRLGAKVTLLEFMPRILPLDDPESGKLIQEKFESEGISVHTGTKLVSVQTEDNIHTLTAETDGNSWSFQADQILVAAGRAPNIEGLDLEKAGVEHDRRGIKIDDYQRTTNKRIYAAGDVANEYKFTHSAYAYAEFATLNALMPFRFFKSSKRHIPYAVYTEPEVAHVGWAWKKLEENPAAWHCYQAPLSHNDRSKIEKATEGFAKLYTKRGSDKIIAATIVGSHAGELIGQLSELMTAKKGLEVLGRAIHPYPTQSEVIRRAADEYMFKKVTPFVKKLSGIWLKWMR